MRPTNPQDALCQELIAEAIQYARRADVAVKPKARFTITVDIRGTDAFDPKRGKDMPRQCCRAAFLRGEHFCLFDGHESSATLREPNDTIQTSFPDGYWTRQDRMKFESIGQLRGVEAIASGQSIRVLAFLQKKWGRGRWRKMKGFARVRILRTGHLRDAEIHWYEAHGIGKRDFKIKKLL